MIKPRILNLLGCYRPGNNATGPVQSFRAMALALKDEFSFNTVSEYSFGGGDTTIAHKSWCDDGYCMVRHCATTPLGAAGLAGILRTTTHDLLLLNGFFDRQFTLPALMMRRARIGPRSPTILSPRGEFATAALAGNALGKKLYIKFANRFGLLKDVWLHATAPHEHEEILAAGIRCRGIIEAPDMRVLPPLPVADEIELSFTGGNALRIIHVARIVPMKNLAFALHVLKEVECRVLLDIYGPVCDLEYWSKCNSIIATLPPNVTVIYRGTIANEKIPAVIASADLLFLPSLGENFGHVIHEALSSGVPVLISDKTPWCNLEENHAGWSIPLANPPQFVERIMILSAMDNSERHKFRTGARSYAIKMHEENNSAERTGAMFRKVLARSH